MCNVEIRTEARSCRVKLWQIAEVLGMNDGNFSRKLRRELPVEERDTILRIIRRLSEGGEVNAREG